MTNNSSTNPETSNLDILGIDLAKTVFQLHGADEMASLF